MKNVELLAPAGSMESLIAAINNGADAIYLGGSKFSARAYASNFDNETMMKAVDYAHSYGVKVYVTMNTLLKQNELKEALKYVGYLYEIGVDALIIQDSGLINLIKNIYPKFELHASTQMTVHNGDGALYFYEKGFQRIVLSRELSLDEIKYISNDLGIETEIFVHGALCVCYSGQCLMSSMIGGRSGNRGRCAQSCRMQYTLKGEVSGERKGYLLSPKDTCLIEDIDAIIKSGTSSLKVEGRMKKPEYVAGVTQNYRKAIDKVEKQTKFDLSKGKNQLAQLFNRQGFAKAYLYKNTGKDMMSFNYAKNTGVFIGKVQDNGEVILEADVALGDGIRFDDDGFTLSKIMLKVKEVKDIIDKYVYSKIVYSFDELMETVDGSIINKWIDIDDDMNPSINEKKVKEYIDSLCEKYNTVGKERKFDSSIGKTVIVKGGYYGWKINSNEEVKALIENIKHGQSVFKEPIYSQKGLSRSDDDIGDTYVEVNITRQHLWFYKNGKLLTQGDIVTGCQSKNTPTAEGVYALNYKQKDATLKGDGYSSKVSYWMPFNGNIGLHDARWRSSFGGNIYKTNGTHGCVNMPQYLAKIIFENIESNTPIICYSEDTKNNN